MSDAMGRGEVAAADLPVAPGLGAGGDGGSGRPGRETLRLFVRNKAAVAGVVMLIGIVFMTVAGPRIYDNDPKDIVAIPLTGPRRAGRGPLGHRLFGT